MARVISGCVITSPSSAPQPVHQLRDALGAEQPHQVVFERQEEVRRARIALAAGAAAQLAVDAPRLVPLGADDVQAADLHRRRSSLPSEILHRRRLRHR